MRTSRTRPGPRVVVVAHGPPLKGGITTVALDLVESPDLNSRFEMVFQNTTQAQDARGTFAIGNVVRAITHALRTFTLARRGSIVHTHSVQDPTLVAWRQVLIALAARLRGARVLLHNHAFRPYMEPPGGYRIGFAHRLAFRILDLLADANIILSAQGLANIGHLMPHTPLPVIPNSVVVDDFMVTSADHDPAVLLFVGELLERKGVLVLLDAFDILSADESLPSWKPVIIGANGMGLDPEKDRIITEIRSRGYGSAMTGAVSRAEVYEHLGAADVFVFPSFVEGQPFSVIEALAAGVPIVASDIPTIADMISNDNEGLLVPVRNAGALAEALREMLRDVPARRKMGANGRARAISTYDRKIFETRIGDLYDEYSR